MPGIPSPFGGGDGPETFDEDDAFVPDHLPVPGKFLDGHEVLAGDDHVAVHQTARDLFEERGVYDMTFDYNLARLNLDTRHTGAGFRYAEEVGDDAVLRAEFSPTTAFCPQTHTLTIGAFRAWNGLSECHDYDLVRIRTVESHHQSDSVNEELQSLEAEYQETGTVPGQPDDAPGEAVTDAIDSPAGPDAPF
ncbi:hypothetical protein [Halolamina salifodinae]|uniref:DUF7998 domain-containing protein n=1 Tax=Halolamina salifodinae TaxID=1202767 RepID=A0A8T4GZ50_9EURY|nr:hypothetical protein [Halolamina salifodinae]MBP1986655.1 hypothetical protein [Halolamina salifodinae]